MLILGSRLIQQPVMSLHTGGEIGRTAEPVIKPADLSIVAYYVVSPLRPGKILMRIEDVRELSNVGFILDSIDELIEPGDVIKLDEAIRFNLPLKNMPVQDEKQHKLGKVIDYTIDADSFMIQQLTVRRPLLKSFSDTELIIHRSQIIEINDDAIVIHSQAEVPEHTRLTTPGSYVNPFRKAEATPESIEINQS